MTPCQPVKFLTPKKFALNGLWFGPAKARRVVVHVHGLGSSAFSYGMVVPWVDRNTAVLTFSNRGHDVASVIKRAKADGSSERLLGGCAHEVFTDCVDDVQGAVDFARRAGAKSVILSGHSTGCQKIVYYASRKRDKLVRGLVLLAPISDYAGTERRVGSRMYGKALTAAHDLLKRGKPHALLPEGAWYVPIDAQRWLSLYTPDSAEEIFTYASGRKPTTLHRVKLPMLVLLAQNDQCADRPALDIARWFDANTAADCGTIQIIPDTNHGFTGAEKAVRKLFRWWSGA